MNLLTYSTQCPMHITTLIFNSNIFDVRISLCTYTVYFQWLFHFRGREKKIAEFSLFPYAFWLAICAQYAIELSCTHSVRLLFVCLFVCTFRSISLVLIVIITVIIIIINIHSHWHSQFRLRISTLAIISVFIHIGFGVMDILPMKKLEKKYGLTALKNCARSTTEY